AAEFGKPNLSNSRSSSIALYSISLAMRVSSIAKDSSPTDTNVRMRFALSATSRNLSRALRSATMFPAFWPLYWALDRSERKVVGYRPPPPRGAAAKDPAAAIARTNLARSACQIAYNARSFAGLYFAGNPFSGVQDSHLRHRLRAGERPRRTGLLPDTERTSRWSSDRAARIGPERANKPCAERNGGAARYGTGPA